MIRNCIRTFKQSGYIYLFIFALISCSKKESDSESPAEILQLSISEAEASPYQYIKLELPSNSKPLDINSKSIQLAIGGISAEAYADSSAFAQNRYSYYLLVPELSTGDKTITIKIADGKVAEGKIKIKDFQKIADIALYIKNRQDNEQTEISEAAKEYDRRVQAGLLRKSTADSLKLFMQQAYEMNRDMVNLLSESEKRSYVQLLEANKQAISDLKNTFTAYPLFNQRMATPGDCESKKSDAEIYRLNGFTESADRLELEYKQCYANSEEARLVAVNQVNSKTNKALEAAKAAWQAKPGVFSGSWAFASTFATEIYKEVLETQFGVKDLNEFFGVKETQDGKQERVAAQEFIANKDYNYSAGIQLVNLNRQDQSLISGFTKMIEAIDYFNEAMRFLGQFLPFAPEIKMPVRKTEKIYVDGYTIDQISDSRIAIETSAGGKGSLIKIKVNATGIVQSINFTFRLNFSSSYGSASTIINATVVIPDIQASLSIVSGNNQTASPNSNLANPLIVAVKDVNGQGVSGVEVQWLVTAGGGQLTSLKATTGQNGQANNTWKLGASGTQTVQAKVLKTDGSNITGSPAVFTASIGNNDTISLLTSKPWTAYEGFYDGNETVIGTTYKYDALCGNIQYQYSSRTDSLRFTFNKNGKGSVQGFGLWSSIDNNCKITETTTDGDTFVWEYIPSLKRIKITWVDDATGEVDDEGWIMNIISLTATGMYTKGTEWWAENGNIFYDDNLELKFR